MRSCRHRLRRTAELLPDGDLRRRALAAALRSCSSRARSRSTLAHAIGNIVFALIAGPGDGADAGPLPRAVRVAAPARRRWPEPCWRRCCWLSAIPSHGERRHRRRPGRPSWLVSVQNSDGGWGSRPGDGSSASITGWAMLGLEAAGRNPLDISQGGKTPVDYLRGDDRRNRKQRRLRPHDPRPRGRRRRRPLLRRRATWSARWPSAAAATAPTKGGRGRPRSRCIALRAAGDDRRPRKVALLAARSPERRRRLGRRTRQAEHRRRHRRRDAGAAELEALPARPLVPAQRRSSRAAASASAAAARRTRSRRRGRSRGSSPPAPIPASITDGRQRARDYLPPARTPTATTATPPRATRPRSGSRARSCPRSPASAFPISPPPPRAPKPKPAPSEPEEALDRAADPRRSPATTPTPPSSSGSSGSGAGSGWTPAAAAPLTPPATTPGPDPRLADHRRGRRAGNSAAVEFEATEPPQPARIRWPRSGSASAPAPSPSAACCSSVRRFSW